MAESLHWQELQKGVSSWNSWRERNNHAPVDLSGCTLDGAKLRNCNLLRADLSGASLRGAQIQHAQLKDANLSDANIEGADFEHCLARGTIFDGVQGRGARFVVATLRSASFRGAQLQDASFYRAYLRQSDFTDANLARANLRKAYLERANCERAIMSDVDMRNASLVRSSLEGADLRRARVYGVAAWSTSLDRAQQQDMLISRKDDEPPMYVDDLNCAHLVSLLVDNARIRPFLDTVSSRFVLIIGRFSAERKPILDLIRREVHTCGYAGVIFDFEKPSDRSFIEVVKTLAGLSRFVIADLTDPRVVHQELDTILSEYPSVPVLPIIKLGHELPATLADHALRQSLIKPVFQYRDKAHIIAAMSDKIISPAESMAADLEALMRGAVFQASPVPPK